MLTVAQQNKFWAHVDVQDGCCCWRWRGKRNAYGYGRVRYSGRDYYAHRLAWEMCVGEIPSDRELDHLCRRTSCVNPLHLEPVTGAENVRRARALITHCPRGHAYEGRNLILQFRPSGPGRQCRICKNASAVRRKALAQVDAAD